MLVLLGTTIWASFFDSLNPSAIAQQMLLQSMVKNKRHVWFFILGIGLANAAMGLAVYYGVAAWVSKLLAAASAAYPVYVYGAAVLAGLFCLFLGILLTIKTARRSGNAEEETAKTPAKLSAPALFIMGVAFCGVELTSALPYFGFLAVLASYQLVFPLVAGFLLLYTFVYVFPLILLYFGYNKLRGTRAVRRLEQILGKVSSYLIPAVLGLLGVFLAVYGAVSLL